MRVLLCEGYSGPVVRKGKGDTGGGGYNVSQRLSGEIFHRVIMRITRIH